MIHFKRGNMFDEKNWDFMVVTTNTKSTMGKGLALECKKRFPEIFKQYKEECQRRMYQPGKIYIYNTFFENKERFILSFTTKDDWRQPGKYEWVQSGLEAMHKLFHNISIGNQKFCRVLVPAVGCGCAGLDWEIVKPMIIKSLGDLDHDFIVFEK